MQLVCKRLYSFVVFAALAVVSPVQTWAGMDYQSDNAPTSLTRHATTPDVIFQKGLREDVMLANDPVPAHIPSSGPIETSVTRKVRDLDNGYQNLKSQIANFENTLSALQNKSDTAAARYFSSIALINTELQSGTTPGNPILVERWNSAQVQLDNLSGVASELNTLATDLANESSKAAFLLDSVRATYGLSGAVKQDHNRLRQVEDDVNQAIVSLNRLLTMVSDEISRRQSYLRSEKLNLQTMGLSVAKGELYGQNLSNSLFNRATVDGDGFGQEQTKSENLPNQNTSETRFSPSRRPLVIIRFDRANVSYEQPLYSAINNALEKYPSARFDLVAVSPTDGNPAELALASSQARKNGESVLRSLSQMGLPVDRVRLNAASSKNVHNTEVHIYLQ